MVFEFGGKTRTGTATDSYARRVLVNCLGV
jgi:hypothetical protein